MTRDGDSDRVDIGSQPTIGSGGDAEALASADTIAGSDSGERPGGDHAIPQRGDVIDRYSVLESLGQGGMGVVVAAYDADLDRRIAIKLLRADAYEGEAAEDARVRLFREAQAMAKLSHPNVVPVYDVGTVDNQVFVAMEYADAGTMRDWVRDANPDWNDILSRYIAAGRGLAAAHGIGLVHRDFKPENVLTHADGRVQVGDFGLVGTSSAHWKPSGDHDLAASPGLDVTLTRAGAVLGTPAYMAPEQFAGGDVDARADQFAFCVSVYEAVYGARPFSGRTYEELQTAVFAGTVAPAPAGSPVPDRVRALLVRGLAPDPQARHESMDALLAELERATQRRLPRAAVAFGAVLACVAAVGLFIGLRGGGATGQGADALARETGVASPADTPRYSEPKQLTFRGDIAHVAINRDSSRMAYVSGRQLRVRSMADGNEQLVREAPFIQSLAWFADGKRLLYIVRSLGPGSGVHIYSTSTRQSRRVAAVAGHASIMADGELALTNASRKYIKILNLGTNEVRRIPIPGTYTWLVRADYGPAARRFLVQTHTGTRGRIWTVKKDGSDKQLVVAGDLFGQSRWDPQGTAIYYSVKVGRKSAKIMRIAIDRDTGRPVGNPQLVAPESAQSTRFTMNGFSVDQRGGLAYVRGYSYANVWSSTRSASGGVTKRRITRGSASKQGMQLSPDGTMVAYTTAAPGGAALVVRALKPPGSPRTLVKLHEGTTGLAWSPDGKQLAYVTVDAAKELQLYTVALGGGPPRRLEVPAPSSQRSVAWAPSPRIAYQLPGNQNFNLVDPRTGKVAPLVDKTRGWYFTPEFSPDGKRVAVFWNRTPMGVWLIDLATRKQALLAKVTAFPIGWSRDGNWVFAFANAWAERPAILRISVASGKVERWLELSEYPITPAQADITADGNTVLLSVVEGSTDAWITRPR